LYSSLPGSRFQDDLEGALHHSQRVRKTQGAMRTIKMDAQTPPHCLNFAPSFVPKWNGRTRVVVSAKPEKSPTSAS
jgi:hypothetical protein